MFAMENLSALVCKWKIKVTVKSKVGDIIRFQSWKRQNECFRASCFLTLDRHVFKKTYTIC